MHRTRAMCMVVVGVLKLLSLPVCVAFAFTPSISPRPVDISSFFSTVLLPNVDVRELRFWRLLFDGFPRFAPSSILVSNIKVRGGGGIFFSIFPARACRILRGEAVFECF